MGNELSRHIDQAQKTGILQLRNFKLTKVLSINWKKRSLKFFLDTTRIISNF